MTEKMFNAAFYVGGRRRQSTRIRKPMAAHSSDDSISRGSDRQPLATSTFFNRNLTMPVEAPRERRYRVIATQKLQTILDVKSWRGRLNQSTILIHFGGFYNFWNTVKLCYNTLGYNFIPFITFKFGFPSILVIF